MGILRSFGVILLSIILFVILISGNLFLTLGLSTDYEILKPEINSIFNEVIKEKSFLNQDLERMQIYCEKNNSEFVLNNEQIKETIVIPCDKIINETENLINYSIEYLINQTYYKEYNCEFWDCFSKTSSPMFLLSQKANNYWFSKYYFFLSLTIIIFIILFFLTENKSNSFFIFGAISTISSLLFIKVDILAEWIIKILIGNYPLTSTIDPKLLTEAFSIFFIKSYEVFLWMFFMGIISIIVGILIKSFGIGMKINNFFSKIKEDKKFSKTEVENLLKRKK